MGLKDSSSLLIPGYWLRPGCEQEDTLLVEFLQRTYQELCGAHNWKHLTQTVAQYLSSQTPLWWVEDEALHKSGAAFNPVACLWLGNVVDQIQGDRHTYIFLLYVMPEHRRRGIGSALMYQAETWARAQGDRQIGLQVFQFSQSTLAFYQSLGYQTQALWMVKPLAFQVDS